MSPKITANDEQPAAGQHWADFVDYAIYLVVRIVFCGLQCLTPAAAGSLSRMGAILLNDILRVRRKVIDENLRHAFPEMSLAERRRLSRRMFEHLLLIACEIALAPRKIHETNWRDHVTLVGGRELVQAMLDDRGIMAVTAHFGNFEMNGYVAGLFGFPTFTLARTLDNRYLHDFFGKFRASTGQFILPTKESAELAQRAIESGHTLAALADHYAGPKGAWVEFFRRPASCHKAIALLSLANKVPLVVLFTKRTKQPLHFQLEFVDQFDPMQEPETPTVTELTQWYTERIETIICRQPDQYWWLHRRWKDPRVKKTRVSGAASPPGTAAATAISTRDLRIHRQDQAQPAGSSRGSHASVTRVDT